MVRISSHAFITELDGYFARNDLADAGGCLERWLKRARLQEDVRGELTIINEYLGFCRQTADKDMGLYAVEEAIRLVDKQDLGNRVSGATILLNAATTLKCFSQPEKAMILYRRVSEVFENELDENDPLFAGLYNNMALAMQDIGDKNGAEKAFLRAIDINDALPERKLETAVTLVNLAHFYYSIDIEDERIDSLMMRALGILDDPENFRHKDYPFHCKKCAPSFGFFGYFADEKRLLKRVEAIYAGT